MTWEHDDLGAKKTLTTPLLRLNEAVNEAVNKAVERGRKTICVSHY